MKRMLILWLVLLLGIAAAMSIGQTMPRQSQLAYITNCNRWENIALADVRVGVRYCMTRSRSTKDQLAWSRDGRYLAYYNYGTALFSLNILDMETGEHQGFVLDQSIYANITQPISWSPNGQQIAFVAFTADGNQDVFLMDVHTGKVSPLHANQLAAKAGPQWSPVAGGKLAYTAWVGNITTVYMTDGEKIEPLGQGVYATWAPTGERLLYLSIPLAVYIREPDGYVWQVDMPVLANIHLDWSPDGERIVVVAFVSNTSDLVLVDLRTGEQEQVTSTPLFEEHPDWSANGRWIAFEQTSGTNTDVVIYDLERGRTHYLTTDPLRDYFPVWRP